MTTLQFLYLFLWILILLECFVRLPKGRLWLSRSFMGWRPPGKGLSFAFGAWRWVFLNPVPLFAGLVLPPLREDGKTGGLSHDAQALAERVFPAQDLLFSCSISATLLFVVLVALMPLAVICQSFDYSIIPALGAVYISNFMTVAVWHGCHARLFPERKWTRLGRTLYLLLYPPVTLRCAVELPAYLFEGYHPLAVAAALIGPKRAKKWLRETYLRRTLEADHAGAGQGAEMTAFARMLEDLYGEIPRPDAAHVNDDPEARACCPVCNTRYARTDGTCAFCPGIALIPISSAGSGPDAPAPAKC